MINETPRVRFAPSPTGFLHVGGLRTALYCELFARKNNGRLILRIEDTDRTRLVDGGVENIIRTLEWAGIKPDEGPYVDDKGQLKQRGDYGPYIQSERLDIYKKYIDQLLENGKAYRCYCTPERLEEMRDHQKSEGTQTMYDRRCRNLDYEICKKLEDEGYSVELIDIRTIAPLDVETIYKSVKKTGKAIVVHEDTLTGGFGAEIAALITENCFESLDGPVRRIGALDTPIPFHPVLENTVLPTRERVYKEVKKLLEY